jgi:eukaryotic-like serine/threonine-protein kinase
LLCEERDHGHLQSQGRGVQLKRGSIVASRYRIDQLIGIGGTGKVYAATHVSSGARAALKVIRELTTRPERIAQEVRIAGTLTHTNIARAHDVFNDDGCTVVVYELCHGCSLADVLKRGPLSAAQACATVLSALEGLSVAHTANVLHRDLKPQNIMLAVAPDGTVVPKLLDFGIAKDLTQTHGITVTQQSLGTPKYMSPEQIRSEKLGPPSDIFSLGAVLFECLTGESPFQADSTAASLAAVLERDVLPDERIPPALWMVIARALSKRSYERYQTCAEFAADLERTAIVARDAIPQVLREIPLAPLSALDDLEPLIESAIVSAPEPTIMQNRGRALLISGSVVGAVVIGTLAYEPVRSRVPEVRTRAIVEPASLEWEATSTSANTKIEVVPPTMATASSTGQARALPGHPKVPHAPASKTATSSTAPGVARNPGF